MSSRIPARRFLSGSALFRLAAAVAFAVLFVTPSARAQITINTHGNPSNADGTVDRRFAQIQPTKIDLPKGAMDSRSKTALIRNLEGEQGWAMRPLPRGHKGLTLVANGKLDPAGEAYLDMVTENGLSVKPGDAVAITDIKFERDKLIFSFNGGPDAKHRFLRHIEIGMGGPYDTPVVPNDPENDPQGAHVTLAFKGRMPAVTDKQVKALLAPLISFDQKTPVQAFTDTLPPVLKNAILNHQVMVGMTTDMVMFALGEPDQKIREMDGQMPFEEWIYGKPPATVQFVRINGNRVIRLEIAKVGEKLQIFTKDEVEGLMRTDGSPLAPPAQTRTVAMGDTHPNPDTQAPNAPPTLRNDGEKLPQDDPRSDTNQGTMKPVQFPEQKPDDYPDATNLPRTPQPDDANKQQDNSQKPAQSQPDKPAPSQPGQPPASQSQDPQPAPNSNPAPAQPASSPQPNQP
ncbi:MAG TPA: hypothetical protein VMD29_10740 [Terracidiphilus sp.]|nr:hypothetical protein [Terracidiphilus sp.]